MVTNPFTKTTNKQTGAGGGTYNPNTGVYTDRSGNQFSTMNPPAGAWVLPKNGGGGGGSGGRGGGSSSGGSTPAPFVPPVIKISGTTVFVDGVPFSVAPNKLADFVKSKGGNSAAIEQANSAYQKYQAEEAKKAVVEKAKLVSVSKSGRVTIGDQSYTGNAFISEVGMTANEYNNRLRAEAVKQGLIKQDDINRVSFNDIKVGTEKYGSGTAVSYDNFGKAIGVSADLGDGVKSYSIDAYNKEVERLQKVIPETKYLNPSTGELFSEKQVLGVSKEGFEFSSTPIKIYVDPNTGAPIRNIVEYVKENKIPTSVESTPSDLKEAIRRIFERTSDLDSLQRKGERFTLKQNGEQIIYNPSQMESGAAGGFLGNLGGRSYFFGLDIGPSKNPEESLASFYKRSILDIKATQNAFLIATIATAPIAAGFIEAGGAKAAMKVAGFAAGEVVAPIIEEIDKNFLPQPKSVAGRIGKAAIEGAAIAENPFLIGVYGEQILKSVLTNPIETAQSVFYKNLPETIGMLAGGGLKIDAKLPSLKLDKIKVEGVGRSGELEATMSMKDLIASQEASLKVTYQIPFTTRVADIVDISNKYEIGKTIGIPEFAQEKLAYEKTYKILKGLNVEVGELRLERLKELPKDPETLEIIKQFTREKGLVVGGTTAIETLMVNGKPINLRRVPRDLELFDPQKRDAGSLAKELASRLRGANKKITVKGNTIGFEGIEGHGVNFQDFGGLNFERYRRKIYVNPEGIAIADPVSTAYNKVFDLLKRVGVKSKKAQELKQDNPEAYKKALYDGKVYVRYPKDVVGALSTAEQAIKSTLEQLKDFSQNQIPILQEYKMLRFGQAKKLIEPYVEKLKFEEAPIEPYFFEGEQAGFFSGAKEIESYSLYLAERILKDKRASAVPKIRVDKPRFSEYYFLDEKGKKVSLNIPAIKQSSYESEQQILPEIKFPAIEFEAYPGLEEARRSANYPVIKNKAPEPLEELYKNIAKFPEEKYPVAKLPKPEIYPAKYPEIKLPKLPPMPKIEKYPEIEIPPIFPDEKIKKPFVYSEQKRKQQNKKSFGVGFNVFGKALKTNKMFKINNYPLTKERAEDVGAYYVAQTLARTFVVKRTQEQAQEDFEFMFIPEGYYKQKQATLRNYRIKNKNPIEFDEERFIQKAKFALDTRAERRQIQEFRKMVEGVTGKSKGL